MVITEVRIKLMEDHNENERLQAFCSVTFDNAFVVRDLKATTQVCYSPGPGWLCQQERQTQFRHSCRVAAN